MVIRLPPSCTWHHSTFPPAVFKLRINYSAGETPVLQEGGDPVAGMMHMPQKIGSKKRHILDEFLYPEPQRRRDESVLRSGIFFYLLHNLSTTCFNRRTGHLQNGLSA